MGDAVAQEFSNRYYGGRLPLTACYDAVRIEGERLVSKGKADRDTVDAIYGQAAGGVLSALDELIDIRDAVTPPEGS